jgi:hypothetical protein
MNYVFADGWTRNEVHCAWQWGHELAGGVEDESELAVVFLLESLQLVSEVGVDARHLAVADKSPHDGNAHLRGALATQGAG